MSFSGLDLNLRVCNLTTPAQYFHVLRRQMMRPFKKPLVIMTPKSLLRADAAGSRLADFTSDCFHEILPGPLHAKPEAVKHVILCSGKVYYDLLAFRDEHAIGNTALVRVEQLHPLHEAALVAAVAAFPRADKLVWCQEESLNMGAWSYIVPRLRDLVPLPLRYAGRDASASPAVGSLGLHKREQRQLIEEAFTV